MRLENSFPMIPISQKRRIALVSAIGWDSRAAAWRVNWQHLIKNYFYKAIQRTSKLVLYYCSKCKLSFALRFFTVAKKQVQFTHWHTAQILCGISEIRERYTGISGISWGPVNIINCKYGDQSDLLEKIKQRFSIELL